MTTTPTTPSGQHPNAWQPSRTGTLDFKFSDPSITAKGLTAYTFLDPALPQLSLDIIVAESQNFEALEQNKVIIVAGALPIPVVSIDDLIGMKERSNRKKDVEDVAALLSLKGL